MSQQMSPQPRRPQVFSAWVLGITLIVGALVFLAVNLGLIAYGGPMTPLIAGAVGVLSLPFFLRYLSDRSQKWALLTAWVFFSLATLLLIVALQPVYSQMVGMVALIELAVPFGVAYATDRSRWWSIIPAYVLVAAAGLFGLTIFGLSFEMLGAFALLSVALPLWILYMLDRSNLWAIVPAGVITAVAVLLLVAFSAFQAAAPAFYVIFHATLALVSFALWLTFRRFDWAIWLAVGFAAAAAMSFILPQGGWAMLALAAGSYIIYRLIKMNVGAKALPQPSAGQPAAPAQPSVPTPPFPQASTTSPPPSGQSVQAAQAAAPQPPVATPTPPSATGNGGTHSENPHWRAILADKAASEGASVKPEDKKPVTGFRPLDPLAQRKPDSDDKVEDEQEDSAQ